MIYKNVTGQKLAVFAYTASSGAAKTGDAAQITAYLSKDFGTAAATNDTNPTELDATNMPGWYVFDLLQAETNAEVLVLAAKSSTSGVVVDQIQLLTQDAAISSRSSHSAADVWSVGTRTLTSFGTLVSDIWAAATRTLTSISDSSGITTLLSRIIGTLASGTHQPQSGNVYAMLDGTGTETLTLKKVVINNPDALGVGIQVNAYNGAHIEGTNRGVTLMGNANQALYLLSDTGTATIYIEGPSTGGKGIAISSPSDGSSLPGASGIYIQTEGGHPGILFNFTDPADALKVANSDQGAWVLDDKLFAMPADTADAVRTELATELARIDADVSSVGGVDAQGVADALKLAPAAGEAAAGSMYDLVGNIEAGSGLTAQETADAVHNLAPAGTPAAGSMGDKLNDMPATILTTAVAAYAGTPGTFGYLLSLLAGLDFTAVNLVATSNAGEITIKRTLNLVAVVSGLTIPADWTACYWTVKRSTDDLDADALVQILVSNPADPDDGVQILMGDALDDESDGSLVVNQALGTVTIALGDASTALLEDAVELVWDVKVHAPGAKTQPGAGTATITTAVTRA